MVERGRGGVIIVASTAGMQPIPYQAVYSATKAFALTFSDALHTELRGTGVRVLAVNPGPVPTEWQEVAGLQAGADVVPGKIPAEQCVARGARRLRARRALVHPRPVHPLVHPRQHRRRRARFSSASPSACTATRAAEPTPQRAAARGRGARASR